MDYHKESVMVVQVHLKGWFARYIENYPDGKVQLNDGDTVRTLAEKLGLPTKFVRIITVNGKQKDIDESLFDGDLIYIFPPAIAGG
jgi:molybdopterin converting factor small subunit